MGTFRIIQRITLPEQQDVDAFVDFMRDEYFPAIHKGPTRVGQVTSLILLRGVTETHESMKTFLMDVGYNGLATGTAVIDNDEVQRKFEAFGARVEPLGSFDEVAAWHEEN